MIIYKTINTVNNKFYVGQDSKNNPNYYGSGLLLNKAIKKYGLENFKKEILEYCYSKEELNHKEKFWISELSATTLGYNISIGGTGGDLFNCLSEQDKIKNIILKKTVAKNKNIMNEKNVFECWVDKYGIDEANKKLKEFKDKQILIQNQKFLNKKEKIKNDYGQIIFELYKNKRLDEIHKELGGIASKRIIREILKELGVNTLSRKGLNSGPKNGNSLLNCEDVISILSLKGIEKVIEISKKYGISTTQIHQIFNKKSYKGCYEPQYQKGNKVLKENLDNNK